MERKLAKKFETAKKAADTVTRKGLLATADDESRCIDALTQLNTLPVSSRLLSSTRIVKPLQTLAGHRNKKIRSAASCLLQTWKPVIDQTKTIIRSSTRSGSCADVETQKKPETRIKKERQQDATRGQCSFITYCDGASRYKVRELLSEALSKVSVEVGDQNMRDSVGCCDPVEVAASVESVMFEKLGPFNRDKMAVKEFPKKTKYTLIMFAMNDPKNPDLRKKVLLGEISPERLVTMKAEEMRKDCRRRGERKQETERVLLKPVWCTLAACMHRIVSFVH